MGGHTSSDSSRLATRHQLAEEVELSVSSLERLWAARATNGHPAPADWITNTPGPARPLWLVSQWRQWYAEYLSRRRTIGEIPGLQSDDLGGPAEFARLCGHADTSTISHWVTDLPEGFPRPDTWVELSGGGRRPQWRISRMQEFAANRPYRGQRGGRPAGSASGGQPYAGDPRLELARQALVDHPHASDAELIRHLRASPGDASSRSTWHRILNAARRSPRP